MEEKFKDFMIFYENLKNFSKLKEDILYKFIDELISRQKYELCRKVLEVSKTKETIRWLILKERIDFEEKRFKPMEKLYREEMDLRLFKNYYMDFW